MALRYTEALQYRLIELLARLGRYRQAEDSCTRYLEGFPNGRHRTQVETILMNMSLGVPLDE